MQIIFKLKTNGIPKGLLLYVVNPNAYLKKQGCKVLRVSGNSIVSCISQVLEQD